MRQKPLSVAIRETRESMLGVLNDSGLQLDIISLILSEISNAVNVQAEQAYQKDLKEYTTEHEYTVPTQEGENGNTN